MDGVIIDSTDTHTRAWQRYLASQGIDQPYIAERMLGKHNSDIVREFFASYRMTADDIVRHGAGKEAVYRELMRPVVEQHLVPGVRAFIQRHSGTPMAVASNAELANVDFVLDSAGLRGFFQAIANGHDVARPKPAPDIYLHTARLLNVDPADCVVFEDSPTGVAAGLAAGMRVVAVLTALMQFDKVELAIRDFHDPRLEAWLSALTVSV
jgi:HAD superfamily hydrolase (TIGR01509 family)